MDTEAYWKQNYTFKINWWNSRRNDPTSYGTQIIYIRNPIFVEVIYALIIDTFWAIIFILFYVKDLPLYDGNDQLIVEQKHKKSKYSRDFLRAFGYVFLRICIFRPNLLQQLFSKKIGSHQKIDIFFYEFNQCNSIQHFFSPNQNRNWIGKNIWKGLITTLSSDCLHLIVFFSLALFNNWDWDGKSKQDQHWCPTWILVESEHKMRTYKKKTWIAIRFLFLKVFFVLQHFLISNESNVKMWNNSSTCAMFAAYSLLRFCDYEE